MISDVKSAEASKALPEHRQRLHDTQGSDDAHQLDDAEAVGLPSWTAGLVHEGLKVAAEPVNG